MAGIRSDSLLYAPGLVNGGCPDRVSPIYEEAAEGQLVVQHFVGQRPATEHAVAIFIWVIGRIQEVESLLQAMEVEPLDVIVVIKPFGVEEPPAAFATARLCPHAQRDGIGV
jgi:hypothetical protein